MKKEISQILLLLCQCCLAVLALAACRGGEEEIGDIVPEDREQGTFFQLTIHTGERSATRVNGPQGGENNEGTLGSSNNENKVYNATVLFYQSADGINATAADAQQIRIVYAFYTPTMEKVSDAEYQSPLLHDDKIYIQRGSYHVLVLVNMGDMTHLKGMTLAEVRDMTTLGHVRNPNGSDAFGDAATLDASLPGLPWRGRDKNVAAYDGFYMTSSADCSVSFGGVDGPEHPVQVVASVSRLAARIDFSPGSGHYSTTSLTFTPVGKSEVTVKAYYEYGVSRGFPESTTDDDKYILTGWCPINLRQDECYLFRRVSEYNDGSHLDYLGTEKAVNIGTEADPLWQQTNYVMDPLTPQKNKANAEAATNAFPFAKTFNKYRYVPANSVVNVGDIAPEEFQLSSGGEGTGDIYYPLAYAIENTLRSDSPKERYATGIILKGYYAKNDGAGNFSYVEKNYVYYIRHSDPTNSNSDALVMKYGIVRNNVYRVKVGSVTPAGIIILEVMNWLNVYADDIYL